MRVGVEGGFPGAIRYRAFETNLVFGWNSALLEKSSFYFLRVFCWNWQNFHFGGGTEHWGITLWSLGTSNIS